MGVGAKVRRMFGPLEGPVTDLYRAFFIDLTHLARAIRRWAPDAAQVLEIGCGEGALSERLSRVYPRARITGIDITPRVGRLFRGDRERVRFAQVTAGAFAADHSAGFDLVLLCDVLHHVPPGERVALLRDAGRLVRPNGALVVKDWEWIPNLGHVLAEFSDRVLTGDDVSYASAGDLRRLLEESFGPECVHNQTRLPPWRNNLAFLVGPPAPRP